MVSAPPLPFVYLCKTMTITDIQITLVLFSMAY